LEVWGGKSYFKVEFVDNPKKIVKSWREKGGLVVHLTMYGKMIDDMIDEITKASKNFTLPLLVVIGSEKVEGWYYYNSDYNIGIGNQPHSEVSALAIFLDRIYKGEELYIHFSDAKFYIIPQLKGKRVVKTDK